MYSFPGKIQVSLIVLFSLIQNHMYSISEFKDPGQRHAYKFYKASCDSIEIVKDGHLQKIHFRVKQRVCRNITCDVIEIGHRTVSLALKPETPGRNCWEFLDEPPGFYMKTTISVQGTVDVWSYIMPIDRYSHTL